MPRILIFGAVLALALTAARVTEELRLQESVAAMKAATPGTGELSPLHQYLRSNPHGLPADTPIN